MAYREKLREGTLAGAIDKYVYSLMHDYSVCMQVSEPLLYCKIINP